MHSRKPLPPTLRGRAFTVSAGRNSGLSESRLRGDDLTNPYYGVRAPNIPDPTLLDHAHALQLRMRTDQFFSHLTAGRLWGVPLPAEFTSSEKLHVSSIAPARPPRLRGVHSHELRVGAGAWMQRHGLPVADPALTWLGLASMLSLPDLVAVGDYLVLDPVVIDPLDMRPHIRLDELAARVARHHGTGKSAAANALPFIREGAESRPESLLRLILVDAGLPEPELNVNLYDAQHGFLGRVDMFYPRWRIVVEYDGDHHRTNSAQYDADMLRRERIARAGYPAVYVRKSGVFRNPAHTVTRVARLLRDAGWRP